jgi:DNA primase
MDEILQIKQNIDIVDLIGGYIALTKSGRNYKAPCPFHSENTPSFMVSADLQIYKCFGCGKGGDIFTFVQDIEGVEFADALKILAEKAGVKLKKRAPDPQKSKRDIIYEINHISAEFYHFVLTEHKIGKQALNYLKKDRKLTEKAIKAYKVGYAPDSWSSLFNFLTSKKYKVQDMLAAGVISQKKSGNGYIDKFRGRVLFPLMGNGEKVLGFMGRTIFDRSPKYLNTSETAVFHKGNYLYGLASSKVSVRKKGAIFVEGPLDVISAWQLDLDNVIATSGTALTLSQLKILSRYTKDVIFCFDSDAAGVTATKRAILMADSLEFNMSIAVIPAPHKDLDELIKASPKEAKTILSNAIPIYDFYLISAIKKFGKESAVAKKKIMEEIAPVFSKISNVVMKDHYIKQVSEELDITEEVVRNIFDQNVDTSIIMTASQASAAKKTVITKDIIGNSIQFYILVLLLKAPLDTAQTVLYKLGQKDFNEDIPLEIFTALKTYLIGRKKKFNIVHFANRFEGDLRETVNNMYMYDLGEMEADDAVLLKEIETTFDRIKRDTLKREIKSLGSQIKQAEKEKDTKLLQQLLEDFKKVSEKLK